MKQPKFEELSIKFTPHLACAYIEGYAEGESATDVQKLQAWSYLVKNNIVWDLQGRFGRAAIKLIEKGLLTEEGEIKWEVCYELGIYRPESEP